MVIATGDLEISSRDDGASWVTSDGDPASAVSGFLVVGGDGQPPLCRAPGGMRRGSGMTTVRVSRLRLCGLTDEERTEYAAGQRSDNARRLAAQSRAKDLLVRHLSPAQRTELGTLGFFHVDGPSGRRYRIRRGSYRNVSVFEGGVETASLCVHVIQGVPDEDTMLAQKLVLSDPECEKTVLELANWYPPSKGNAVRSRPDGSAAVVAIVDGRRVPILGDMKVRVFSYTFDDLRPGLACVVIDGFVAPLAPE